MRFSLELVKLFQKTIQRANTLGVKCVNSAFILGELLLAEESPLYDSIFLMQLEPTDYFASILETCYQSQEECEDDGNEKLERQTEDSTENEGSKISYTINGKEEVIFLDNDMLDVICKLKEISKDDQCIDILKFSKCLIDIMPETVLFIFKNFGIDIKIVKTYLESIDRVAPNDTEDSTFKLPTSLTSFVTDLTEQMRGKECVICGRDKECQAVMETLQKDTKKSVVLVGEPGVGKTSIMEKITSDILSGNCPEELKNSRVLSLNVTSSVAGTKYRGEAEERFSELTKFLENTENIILFIDEIHLIIGAGACNEGEADLANALKPILAGRNVRIIGATTYNEYEKYFSKDGAIKRRFRKIDVAEPKSHEVYPMLKETIKKLSQRHGVTISREMVDFCILNSAAYTYDVKNPDRTKDLIDLAMVKAKNKGKDCVDRESVMEIFSVNIEKFRKMRKQSKKSVAYHEAGHCLVGIYSKYLKQEINIIAVSIMPAEDYLGVNVFEHKDAEYVDTTMEYFYDKIAFDLAGRVAEELFTNKYSAGAAADLQNATLTAEAIVTEFGMTKAFSNTVVLSSVNSQETMNKVQKEIEDIIEQGRIRAETMIKEHKDFLEKLVDKLMEQGIVNEKDIKKLVKDVSKKNLAKT